MREVAHQRHYLLQLNDTDPFTEALRGIGDEEKLGITKQVSPVAWHNINLNGTYSFDFEQNLIDIEEIMRPITETGGNV